MIKNSKAKKRLAQIVDEFQPDIIHSNSSVIGVGFDVAKKKGIPHIYHFREYADKIPVHFLPSEASFLKKIQTDNSFIICIVKDMIEAGFWPTGKAFQLSPDAKKYNKDAQVGETIEVEVQSKEFSRIAAQNAKNVILQKIREEERSVIYNQFNEKEKNIARYFSSSWNIKYNNWCINRIF